MGSMKLFTGLIKVRSKFCTWQSWRQMMTTTRHTKNAYNSC